MIVVHTHRYAPGGPREADGTPTCAACGLPEATPTTTHPDAVVRYGAVGRAIHAHLPVMALTSAPRMDHPNATPHADLDRSGLVTAQHDGEPQ